MSNRHVKLSRDCSTCANVADLHRFKPFAAIEAPGISNSSNQETHGKIRRNGRKKQIAIPETPLFCPFFPFILSSDVCSARRCSSGTKKFRACAIQCPERASGILPWCKVDKESYSRRAGRQRDPGFASNSSSARASLVYRFHVRPLLVGRASPLLDLLSRSWAGPLSPRVILCSRWAFTLGRVDQPWPLFPAPP